MKSAWHGGFLMAAAICMVDGNGNALRGEVMVPRLKKQPEWVI